MSTLKVGIAGIEAFKARTLAIASGAYKPAPDDPRIWFSSIESFAKILSERNRDLLKLIAETDPSSLDDLATKAGRAPSNLSRTLKTMEAYGLVRFEKGRGRRLAPRVLYTDIQLDMSLRTAAPPRGAAAR